MNTLDPAISADLVERIAAGEERAEAELIERSGRVLRFLARRLTRTEADAEDLFQDTLLLALEKIRRQEVQQPERLAGFLRALVRNLSTQQYRRRHHSLEEPLESAKEEADKHQRGPLAGLLERETRRLTRSFLDRLKTPRDREVLFRYYLGEESSSQICRDLDLAPEHFYRVLFRARERFRRLWEVEFENQPATSGSARRVG